MHVLTIEVEHVIDHVLGMVATVSKLCELRRVVFYQELLNIRKVYHRIYMRQSISRIDPI